MKNTMLTVAVAVLLVASQATGVQESGARLEPGLLTTVGGKDGAVWHGIEPKIAGTWPAGHSPDPSIGAEAFEIAWRGAVRIPRAGKYRFSAVVRGRFQLNLDNRPVLRTEDEDAGSEAVKCESEWMALEPGDIPLTAHFQKRGETARIQLMWESEDFARVPVPATALGHDKGLETLTLRSERSAERGKSLVGENRCGACHAGAPGEAGVKAADLTDAAGRFRPAWLMRWLEDPGAVRPGVAMPRLFDATDSGKREREDVTRYLTQLRPRSVSDAAGAGKPGNAARGKSLFASRGCVACHDLDNGDASSPGAARASGSEGTVSLAGIGSKYRPGALAAYLTKPAAVHRSGEMPDLKLSGGEIADVAEYLSGLRLEEPEAPAADGVDIAASVARGRGVVRQRCLSCHEIEGESPELVKGPAFGAATRGGGCLQPVKAAGAPHFTLSSDDRTAILAKITDSSPPRSASSSLTTDARRTIERFRCLQCHVRDGQGGGLDVRQRRLLGAEGESEIEQVAPPDLTGAGSKLRPEWMREMFVKGKRARPWMQARMPHFDAPEVAALAEGLAALDGEELASEPEREVKSSGAGLAGQDLVGRQAFNCIQCHDLAGAEASVAFADSRGPDLMLTPSRIREFWFRAWLLDPQALSPGTKMPAYFPGGKSTLEGRHGLDADGQIRALYDYFGLGKKAPLPAGLGNERGWSWTPGAVPVSLRTPLDNAPRSICVGFPGGASIAFDAARGRLHQWWQGGFLRMDGTQWTGNHGPYPSPEGTILWTSSPTAVPWRLTAPGAEEGDEPLTPRFLGYSMRGENLEFKTRWSRGDGAGFTVTERYVSAPSKDLTPNGTRYDRHVKIEGLAPGQDLWILVTEARKFSGSFSTVPSEEGTAAGGGLHTSSPHDKKSVPFSIRGDDLPPGSEFKTTSADAFGTRVWFRVKSAGEARDFEFWTAVTYGGGSGERGPLPEAWKAADGSGDPFAAAPRVAGTRDGVAVKGKNPFALEEKSYPIEAVPVPEEIILQGGGLDFLPDGTLAVCTRRGEVWLLENAVKDSSQHRWRRFAKGLHEPLGLTIVDGVIHVLQKPEITKLVDRDGDRVCDDFVCVNSEWGLSTNFHEFAFGLEHVKDGSFFGTLGLAIIPGGATRPEQVFARGGAFRVDKDGKFEVLALGARTPNGTGVGANGELYYTDNQGDYVPACKLTSVKAGEFYGQRFALPDRDAKVEVTPPVCWLPYGVVSQSATDVLLEDRAGKFGPFAGQLLVGELTNSQILRVQLETVRGREQGTVWIFRRGFTSGVNRLAWGPDGALYVAQTTGGWGARGAKLYALEKVLYNGVVPFEMKSVHLTKSGFEVEFTKPVKRDKDPSVSVEQFRYHYWSTYGSPEIDRKPVKVTGARWSEDGKTLTIECPGLVEERICEIRLRGVESADGEPLVHAECWYTLNAFPE